jgi:hypothetical protein
MILGVRFTNVKKNIALIMKIQPHDRLTYEKGGILKKVDGKINRLSIDFKNFFLLKRHSRHVKRLIISSFSIFLHDIKNPLTLEHLNKTYEMTVKFTEIAIEKIGTNSQLYDIQNHLFNLLNNYKKSTFMQMKTLRQVKKAVDLSLKNPLDSLSDALLYSGQDHAVKTKLGASGSYLIKGSRRYVAGVFKPFDEEIGAPNNPFKKSYRGSLASRLFFYNIHPGSGIFREVAAYRVSQLLDLNIVPPTCFARFKSKSFYQKSEGFFFKESKMKEGSFQEFYAGYLHLWEMPRTIIESITQDQMQRVLILDIIIGNMDRNYGNLLTDGKSTIAIDHALSFATVHQVVGLQDIKDAPQYQTPIQPWLANKVLNISLPKLKSILKNECFIEEKAIACMLIRLKILQECIKNKKNATDILKLINSRDK